MLIRVHLVARKRKVTQVALKRMLGTEASAAVPELVVTQVVKRVWGPWRSLLLVSSSVPVGLLIAWCVPPEPGFLRVALGSSSPRLAEAAPGCLAPALVMEGPSAPQVGSTARAASVLILDAQARAPCIRMSALVPAGQRPPGVKTQQLGPSLNLE